MNKIKIHIIVIVLSMVAFYLEMFESLYVGEIINRYFPCKQDPTNSFPCFGVYDMGFMALLVIIFVIVIIDIIFILYRSRKS